MKNAPEVARKLAVENNLHKSEKYDLAVREYDGMLEVIGFTQDPRYSPEDFVGKEFLQPFFWVTLGVFDPDTLELV